MMKIAIDVSPLKNSKFLQHRVRGTGFYIENLKTSLLKYFSQNKYIFFTRGEKLPKSASWRIDLVHYPYFEPFFLSLPIFNKYKTVVTVHDLTPLVFKKYFPAGLRGNIKWQIQKLALKSVNVVITDSECSKKDIIKHTGIQSSKIHVVYLAAGAEFKKIDKSSILDSIREKYGLPEKFVLYVGDVTWNKNLPRLIKAIKKINTPLVMVGNALIDKNFDKSNPWNQDLVEVEKLVENDNKIIRLGFIPQEDLIALYNAATVFAMPSTYEGFGLPILEAMSCGCPVVTTKEGSLKEVAGESVYYVDAYDVDSIVNGVNKVLFDEKLREELSEKGLQQTKKYSWKKTAEETISVYKEILK